jgi:hypothetical protein
MNLVTLLPRILLALGAGFLVANVLMVLELLRWRRRRSTAVLVWPARKPPYYGMSLGIGVVLGFLVLFKAWYQLRPPSQFFGELMMFVYYGYMLPLSTRITRGLYADGIWTDTSFVPYTEIGGITWRESGQPTLLVIPHAKTVARRLEVPAQFLGEVRRVLRDKITSHAIEMGEGPGLHLGARDARDSV